MSAASAEIDSITPSVLPHSLMAASVGLDWVALVVRGSTPLDSSCMLPEPAGGLAWTSDIARAIALLGTLCARLLDAHTSKTRTSASSHAQNLAHAEDRTSPAADSDTDSDDGARARLQGRASRPRGSYDSNEDDDDDNDDDNDDDDNVGLDDAPSGFEPEAGAQSESVSTDRSSTGEARVTVGRGGADEDITAGQAIPIAPKGACPALVSEWPWWGEMAAAHGAIVEVDVVLRGFVHLEALTRQRDRCYRPGSFESLRSASGSENIHNSRPRGEQRR